MHRSGRRLTVGVVLTGIGALLYGATSWACIFLGGITASATTVQPGGSLGINGLSFGSNPVELHLDGVTGPLLATVTPDAKGNFSQAVIIPPDVGTGSHVLVATEAPATPDGSNSGSAQGVPSRVAFQVGTAASSPVTTPRRPVQVASTVGVGTLVVIGLAVACAGVLLGGLISLVAARSRRAAIAPVT
jgi:hypothetical protein